MSAVAVEEYCPMCGSPVEAETGCVQCRVERPPARAERLRSVPRCRICGRSVGVREATCENCGAENPAHLLGLAPIAQFVLTLFMLAVVLAVLGLMLGPLA